MLLEIENARKAKKPDGDDGIDDGTTGADSDMGTDEEELDDEELLGDDDLEEEEEEEM